MRWLNICRTISHSLKFHYFILSMIHSTTSHIIFFSLHKEMCLFFRIDAYHDFDAMLFWFLYIIERIGLPWSFHLHPYLFQAKHPHPANCSRNLRYSPVSRSMSHLNGLVFLCMICLCFLWRILVGILVRLVLVSLLFYPMAQFWHYFHLAKFLRFRH